MKNLHWSKNVYFYPWVGEQYWSGNERLLILGESHYLATGLVKKSKHLSDGYDLENTLYSKGNKTFHITGDENKNCQEFTCIVTELWASGKWKPRTQYWQRISLAICGKKFNDDDKKYFWGKVAFFNYVQETITKARVHPSKEMLINGRVAFIEVMQKLNPTHVLVISKRLWVSIREQGQIKDLIAQGDISLETCELPNGGKQARVTYIPHPSAPKAYFKSKDWSPFLEKFLGKNQSVSLKST